MEIDWDGTVKVLTDETDAGEFSMVVATFDDLTLDNLLDLAYTIEENKPNRQVWATYSVDEANQRTCKLTLYFSEVVKK